MHYVKKQDSTFQSEFSVRQSAECQSVKLQNILNRATYTHVFLLMHSVSVLNWLNLWKSPCNIINDLYFSPFDSLQLRSGTR